MGQMIGQGAGQLIGGAFGGPFGAALGGAIGGLAGSYIGGGGKDQVREGPRLANLRVSTSKYGEEILSIIGRMRPAGKVIWSPPIIERVNESKESAGKGGGPEVTTRTFVYFASWANLICEGEMGDILRIWFDARLMYDVRESASPATRANSIAWAEKYLAYYPGTETQPVDPTIVAYEGMGNVNANLGIAYAVFTDYPLEDFGNRRPSVSFEVAQKSASSSLVACSEDSGNGLVYQLPNMSTAADLAGTIGTSSFAVAFNSANTLLAVGGDNGGYVDIFETSGWTIPATLNPAPTVGSNALAFSPDDSLLVVGYENSPWWGRYQTSDFTELPYIALPFNDKIKAVAFSPDGRWCALGTPYLFASQTDIFVFDTTTWTELGIAGPQLPNPFMGVRSIDFSNDGKWMAVGVDFDLSLLIYEVGTWTLLTQPPGVGFNQGANDVRFSEDNAYLAYAYNANPRLAVWKTAPNTSDWVRLPDVAELPLRANGVAWDAGTTELSCVWGLGGQGEIYRYRVSDWARLPDPPQRPAVSSRRVNYDIGFLTAETIPRRDVIAQICDESGLTGDQYDVSAITGDEVGVFYGLQSGRSKLENLAIAGFFNGVESQGAIRFRPRGVHSGVTINVNEMVVGLDGGEPGAALTIVPGDEIEVPQLLSISYPQDFKGYEQGEAHQARQVTDSIKKEQIDVRVVMDAQRATRVADTALYQMWAERKQFKFALTMKYYFLDPGDVITIEDSEAGNVWTVRLTSIVIDAYVLLQVEGVEENLGLYDSNADGAGGPAEDDEVPGLGDTTAVMLDVPMLLDSQNDARIYYVLAGADKGWVGGILQRSNDGGTSYETVASTAISGTIGITDTLLADGIHHTWDRVNTVDVTLDNPEQNLESRDELAVLNGANVAALGDDGRWEIIQYVNAELIGPGQYRLSKLLRGQLGTEHNKANHTISDRFVVLSRNLIASAPTSLAELNRARLYKGVSVGQDPALVAGFPYSYTGVNLKPYSPVKASGVRDGSNNLTVTFFRRSRFSAALLKTPILGETIERYQFDILNPGVVNTYETTTTTFFYSATEQTADGITPGDPVTMRIFMMSEAVGRGYPLEVTV